MEGRQACPLPFGIGAAAVIRYGLTEITIHAHPGRPGHARNAARGNSDTPLSGGVSEDKARTRQWGTTHGSALWSESLNVDSGGGGQLDVLTLNPTAM